MKLKRLTLQGYKTFAGRTEFVFDQGITAIVGPNGSGKSNIADALSWVLGEQSYSALRGKRTVDMIFAGSQTRNRAGIAQAKLVLDNSDNWLPIDYGEVEIGRRALRSGENEYTINGQKVRLKDVTELLASSGLAERTYTIIGQGLIDRALSLRADERRALFEEAAGINHYKNRRAETLRRLQETQHNLERVHDILAEIKPRLAALKGQATRARNYEQVSQDLRHLLRIWYGFRWDQAREALRRARKDASTAENAWQQTRHALLVHQQNVESLQQQIGRSQQRIAELLEDRERIRAQLETARREAAVSQEREQALRNQLAEIARDLPLLEEQRVQARDQLATATADLALAQEQLETSRAAARDFQASFQEQQKAIARWQQHLGNSEQKRDQAQRSLAQSEGQLSQLHERLADSHKDENGNEDTEIARLLADMQRQEKVLQDAQEKVQSLRRQRDELQERRQQVADGLKELRSRARDSQGALEQHREQVARLETRLDLLDQLRFKEVKISDNVDFLGAFASLVEIAVAQRPALEAALGSRLAALVVKNSTDLWKLLSVEKQQTLFAAALDQIQTGSPPPLPADPEVTGWASQFVTCPVEIEPLVDLLLGRVLLVESREAAYRLAPQLPAGGMAVTAGRFVVHAGGLVETMNGDQPEGILSRETAWRETRERLVEATAALAKIEHLTADQQADIQRRQDELDKLQNEDRQFSRAENETLQHAALAQRRVDRARQQQIYLERQKERRLAEHGRLRDRITGLEMQIAAARAEVAGFAREAQTAQEALEDLPVAQGQQEKRNLQQQAAAAETIVAGRQAVVDSRATTLRQLEQQWQRLEERRQALTLQREQLATGPSLATQRQWEESQERLEANLKPFQERLAADREQLLALQEKSAGLQRQAHEAETRYTQTQVRLTQQENQIEALQERIHADLGLVALRFDHDQTGPTPLPMHDVVEELPQVATLPADIEASIHQYRGQLQRMGAINPDAPLEYEETQKRYEFLTQQVEDLQITEQQMRQVIGELDDLTSRAFAKTVEEVDAVFGETFRQLFGGGSARLVLTEPDDLTVSGVDIVARLPNRREQGLGLLSGGERSLTASALVFSLLKVSPTPFCVLDEVDAALDEANINRFREILRELSLKIQFIVITHNRGTVQAAQTIYGVSMQPDSTSQVISIRPEEYMRKELI